MPTFSQINQSDVVLALANGTLAQLYRTAAMPGAGVTDVQSDALAQYFEKGQQISILRPKDLGSAQDYDPRSGSDATTVEAGYVNVSLQLEKLFTSGFPVYSHDANVERYIRDYAGSTGGALRKSIDDYFYTKAFRDWTGVAASGAVNVAAHPPLAIVAADGGSGSLTSFNKNLLINAGKVLDSRDVPNMNRVARLGVTAKAGFLGDSQMVEGFAGAGASMQPGTSLIASGFGLNVDVERYGFLCRGSNAVTGQDALADTGDGNPSQVVGAVVDDTTVFFEGDQYNSTPLGAVRLTITQTANLAAGVAVGKIARIGADAGAAVAFGVILRVDAANKYVWLVPYAPDGTKLTAANITATTDKFSIPAIGEISTASHREQFVYATRQLRPPTPGSGALAEAALDQNSGLLLQIFKGSYNVHQFKEGIRTACLCGATPTDWRKGVLMITA